MQEAWVRCNPLSVRLSRFKRNGCEPILQLLGTSLTLQEEQSLLDDPLQFNSIL
jgi:hypothetical protein